MTPRNDDVPAIRPPARSRDEDAGRGRALRDDEAKAVLALTENLHRWPEVDA